MYICIAQLDLAERGTTIHVCNISVITLFIALTPRIPTHPLTRSIGAKSRRVGRGGRERKGEGERRLVGEHFLFGSIKMRFCDLKSPDLMILCPRFPFILRMGSFPLPLLPSFMPPPMPPPFCPPLTPNGPSVIDGSDCVFVSVHGGGFIHRRCFVCSRACTGYRDLFGSTMHTRPSKKEFVTH